MAFNYEHSDRENSSGKQFKREDLLEYSDIFASEFNKSALHDRILVLKVIKEDHVVIPPENFQYEVNETTENNPIISIASEDEIEEVSTSVVL